MRISGESIAGFGKKARDFMRGSRFLRPLMGTAPFNERNAQRRKSGKSLLGTFEASPAQYAGMKKPKPRVLRAGGVTSLEGAPAMDLRGGSLTLEERRKADRRSAGKKSIVPKK